MARSTKGKATKPKTTRATAPKRTTATRKATASAKRKPAAKVKAKTQSAARATKSRSTDTAVRALAQRIIDVTLADHDEEILALYAPTIESSEAGQPRRSASTRSARSSPAGAP